MKIVALILSMYCFGVQVHACDTLEVVLNQQTLQFEFPLNPEFSGKRPSKIAPNHRHFVATLSVPPVCLQQRAHGSTYLHIQGGSLQVLRGMCKDFNAYLQQAFQAYDQPLECLLLHIRVPEGLYCTTTQEETSMGAARHFTITDHFGPFALMSEPKGGVLLTDTVVTKSYTVVIQDNTVTTTPESCAGCTLHDVVTDQSGFRFYISKKQPNGGMDWRRVEIRPSANE